MTIRTLAVAAVCALIAATLATSAASVPGVHRIPYGVDAVFASNQLNWNTQLDECNFSWTSCTSASQPTATGSAIVDIHNPPQPTSRMTRALTGLQYELYPLCNDPSIGPMEAKFDATVALDSNVPPTGGRSQSTARLYATPSGLPTLVGTSTEGQRVDLTFADKKATATPVLNTTLQAFVEVESMGELTLPDSPFVDERAFASASATLRGISLKFGDDYAPVTQITLNGVGADPAPGANFGGYFKSDVLFTIASTDPRTDGVSPVAQSCVDYVTIKDGSTDLGTHFPGMFQNATSFPATTERRYDIRAQATDHNGNTESSPRRLAFIVDKTAPVVTASPVPANATGKNGWYNASGVPVIRVVCDDLNGAANSNEVSGCKQVNWTRSTGGSGRPAVADYVDIPVPDAHAVSVTANGLDRANNGGTSDTAGPIKVDRVAPGAIRNLSRTSPGGDWYNGSVTMRFSCDGYNETMSGCASIQTRLNNTGPWTDVTVYDFTVQSNWTINVRVEDNAGNVGLPNYEAHTDFTLPSPVKRLFADPPGHVDGGQNFVKGLPTWKWDRAEDRHSWVDHYRLELNGVFIGTRGPNDRQYTPLAITDGWHNLTVRAVDAAGNIGNPVTKAIIVDRVAPDVNVTSPLPGRVYLWDGGVIELSNPNAPAMVLNGVTVVATSWDPPNASHLIRTRINGTISGLPCNAGETREYCAYHEEPEYDTGVGAAPRLIFASGQDRSQNVGYHNMSYVRADAGVFRMLPSSGMGGSSAGTASTDVQGLVFWKGTPRTDLVQYEIHRSTQQWFAPTTVATPVGPPTLVHTVTDPTQTSWVDPDPYVTNEQGERVLGKFYYKLVYVHTGLAVSWISHETYMDYASQELGDYQPCDASKFTCVS